MFIYLFIFPCQDDSIQMFFQKIQRFNVLITFTFLHLSSTPYLHLMSPPGYCKPLYNAAPFTLWLSTVTRASAIFG
jgi:hypothetical protein